MKTKLILSAICFIFSTVIFCSFQSRKINQQQAIKLAEDFVRCNGYTKMPIDTTIHKLSYELWDGYLDMATLIKQRHNTLQPKAFCISYNEQNKVWNIGFLSVEVQMKELDSNKRNSNLPGRCVIVSDKGNDIRMAHKTPLFSLFKKL